MEPTAKQWGRSIRAQRRALGLTQAEFADMVGVTQATASRWELGTSLPRHQLIPKIASVLCVPAELLFRYPPGAAA